MSVSDFERFEEFEKDLLRSAQADEPTAASRAANRAAVMEAAGFAAGTSAAGAAGKTSATTAKGGALAKLAAVPKLLMLVAGGIVAAGIAVTAVAVRGSGGGETVPAVPSPSGSSLSMPPTANTAPIEAEPAPYAASPEVVTPNTVDVVDAGPTRSRPVAAPPPTMSVSATPAPNAPPPPALDPLAEETRLLEEARACADRGDLSCASAKLDEHRTRFTHGTLSEEAALLRIQVARRRGDAEEARRLASELLRANPSGPYARRARAILDELPLATPPSP